MRYLAVGLMVAALLLLVLSCDETLPGRVEVLELTLCGYETLVPQLWATAVVLQTECAR